MRTALLFIACLLIMHGARAQQVDAYSELHNPVSVNPALWEHVTSSCVSWGDTDTRYKKEEPAPVGRLRERMLLTAWKGEKVSAQFVVWTPCELGSLSFSVSDLRSGKDVIPATAVETGFVRYVMTDELNKDGKGACGYRNNADFDSTLVADPIDHLTPVLSLPPCSTQPGWVSVRVPRHIPEGKYTGTVTVKDGERVLARLILTVHVKEHTLPVPGEWTFHLDLWQNPYAVARYHGVELFGNEHFALLRPLMQRYADAGGKVITTTITERPWNGQTYDPYGGMITWLKRADGTWYFDYTLFDKWVEFMQSLGVRQQINCFSMIPWRLSFPYFDQASNSIKYLNSKPGEKAYKDFWVVMLRSFARHLKAKGWFSITHIAVDERPIPVMLAALEVIREADPDFKVAYQGTYHDELVQVVDDYCVAFRESFHDDVLRAREATGQVSTYYTCCTEPRPNTFTFSPPAEAEWLGWHAAKENVDGYLRWALNSWVETPLQDSRFTAWAGGDTYLLYPDGRSSIRFERLVQGIQAYEKIKILRERFTRQNNRSALKQIDRILQLFDKTTLDTHPAAEVVNRAKEWMNRY